MSDKLLKLIHSLSPTEKRHFKIYSNRHAGKEGNSYLKLYGELEKAVQYDEDAIRKKLANEPMLRQLGVAKNYLQEQILHSLTSYHRKASIQMEIREALNRIEILNQKGLTDLTEKILKKAWKKACQFELATYQLELINWWLRLIRRKKSKDLAQLLEEFAAAQTRALRCLADESQLRTYHDELFVLVQTGGLAQDPEKASRVEKIMDDSLVTEKNNLTFDAKIVRQFLFVWHGILLHQPKMIEAAYRKSLEIWEKNPHQIAARQAQFARAIFSHMDSCFLCGRFDDYHSSLARIRSLKAGSTKEKNQNTFLSFHLELRYLFQMKQYTEAEELIYRFEHELPHLDLSWNSSVDLTFFYNIMLTFFILKKYRPSLKWVNRILNHPQVDARKDIQNAARIFNLIVHFELENYDILDNLIRSSKRFLSKKGGLSVPEAIILQGINRAIQHPDGKKAALEEMAAELQGVEDRALGLENVVEWVLGR